MKTIKTAISIDITTFHLVERLARKLHMSRSQVFSQAARHMIAKDENLELVRKINAAIGDSDENDNARNRAERAHARLKVVDAW